MVMGVHYCSGVESVRDALPLLEQQHVIRAGSEARRDAALQADFAVDFAGDSRRGRTRGILDEVDGPLPNRVASAEALPELRALLPSVAVHARDEPRNYLRVAGTMKVLH